MIKKAVLFLALLIPGLLFAEQKNIISRQTYKISEIENLAVNVLFEDIHVSTIYGDEILVETGSNNNQFLPVISTDGSTLSIKTNERCIWTYGDGNVCAIYIYVPFDYIAQSYTLKSANGKIFVSDISAQNSVKITGGDPETKVSNIKTDYFNYQPYNEGNQPVVLSNISCTYFEVFGFIGDISLSLAKAPEATSVIRTKEGAINLAIPDSEDFDLLLRSTHSTAINNYIGQLYPNIRNGLSYCHNKGGAEITVQTFKGQITVGK